MVKLVGFFLTVTLIPLALVGYLSFSSARDTLRERTLAELVDARDQAARGVGNYMQNVLDDTSYLGKNPSVHGTFKALEFYYGYASALEYAKTHPDAPIDMSDRDFMQLADDYDPIFMRFLENFEAVRGYEDVLLIVDQNIGLIMYSARKLSDLGTTLTAGPLKDSAPARLWSKVVKERKPALADFSRYEPSGTVSAFLGVPVFKDPENLYGVLLLRFGPKPINDIMSRATHMGKTSDLLLVGQDGMLRSISRQLGGDLLKTGVPLGAAGGAFQGKTGQGETVSSDGVKVLYAWSPVGLPTHSGLAAAFDWATIARIDASEAYSAVTSLAYRVILITAAAGIVAAVLVFLIARAIAMPMITIAGQVSRISEGDLTVEILKLKRRDELGRLANAVSVMVGNLRDQIKGLLQGVQVLSASAQEISITVSQVAENTSKTSAAVAETTTTVEQVRQAASVSGDKAKHVAHTSRKAVDISEDGKNATKGTLERMTVIREQMESIADTVVKLSDESKTIEEIIVTVQDLAGQSNLLAVNASIEAARAGDQGRGFAVVANEIKNLADQSKEATDQVRSILENTRKNISAVVMATEQGTKAVVMGVEQSDQAGDAIKTLAGVVETAAQAAGVIEASSDQQFAGVEQVSRAMADINHAIRENLDGIHDLEGASRKLEDLGMSLEQFIGKYRV
ncbi:MAG: methyl-accepting chemotaxis protein [Desulfomonilaceae bacterium]|nr:methyl-accepting chemotaxis protein [Desulfomonilaceae bacterium]